MRDFFFWVNVVGAVVNVTGIVLSISTLRKTEKLNARLERDIALVEVLHDNACARIPEET